MWDEAFCRREKMPFCMQILSGEDACAPMGQERPLLGFFPGIALGHALKNLSEGLRPEILSRMTDESPLLLNQLNGIAILIQCVIMVNW